MELIKPNINLDFVGNRKYAYILSGSLILLTIVFLIVRGGPNFGIDFAGGILVQVKFNKETSTGQVRNALESASIENTTVQDFSTEEGSEYLVRIEQEGVDVTEFKDRIQTAFKKTFGEGAFEVRRVEMVGPKVGKDLRQKALFAVFYAILFIAIYISGRFELKWLMSIIMAGALLVAVYLASLINISVVWLIVIALIVTLGLCWVLRLRYALGAVVALIHDVIITVGAFSFFNKEITLPIVAALLTIIGYSLNDTIIVFDRIRENLRKGRRTDFSKTINSSINETLSRTILTSGTTLVVVVSLFILGGGVIHDFAFALLVGIVVGTYSSIYVASPILLALPAADEKGGMVSKRKR
ncbi:MAG: protein translocase subunit SecF [Deltaproteobacteria bacterium]|nr:protein translocase subunit SecF [Deltaproteobacteria bacterium]